MHNAGSITESFISKLAHHYVPFSQEDKDIIRSYMHSNVGKVHIIISNLEKFPIGSVVDAMYSFVYKKSGILGLLEVIADKNEHQNIVQRASKYCDPYQSLNKKFLMENLQEFLAFRAFIYDESECQWGKENYSDSYKARNRNWTVAYNNCLLIKSLLIDDKISFKKLCDEQGTAHYDGETLEEGIFEVWLKRVKEKVKDYVKKQNSTEIQSSMIDLSNEIQLTEQQPRSLLLFTAIALVNKEDLRLN